MGPTNDHKLEADVQLEGCQEGSTCAALFALLEEFGQSLKTEHTFTNTCDGNSP